MDNTTKETFLNTELIDLNIHQAFVYEIHNHKLDLRYIGKKALFSITHKPPLKGRKNRRKVVKESNWRTYFSSSETVNGWNQQDCVCTILVPCLTRGESTYVETKLMWLNDVLNPDNNYVNRAIGKFRRWYPIST